jgi:ribosomal protein S18 acetylase RimI-like enzyme
MMDTLIKEMRREQIPGVVSVHLVSFEGFFLSFLGPAFLRELYTSLVEDPSGMCLVALEKDQVVGFVAGTSRSSGVYSRLLRQRFLRFGLAAVPAILKRPAILPRLMRSITGPDGGSAPDPDRGTLMSIAVLPSCQGKGVGQELVRAFLKQASREGLREVDLTTDKHDNEAANSFYEQIGFRKVRDFTTPEGRVMNQYLIEVS